MRKLRSNITTGQLAISRERGVESQLRAAAQRGYPNPEDAKNPMMAHPENEIHQSGRVMASKQGSLVTTRDPCSGIFLFSLPFGKNFLRIIIDEQPRSGRPRRTRLRKPRGRRPRKVMINSTMPKGNHHLGHGDSRRLVTRLHLSLGNRRDQIKRVSVLFGKHQLIGIAQIKRVSVLIGKHQLIGIAQIKRVSVLIGRHQLDRNSSDQTCERSDWKASADWNSSDQTCERSDWKASADWNSSDQTCERSDWKASAERNSSDQTCERPEVFCFDGSFTLCSILSAVLLFMNYHPAPGIDSLGDCGRPCDPLSCLLFTALWLRCNQTLVVQETPSGKDVDLTCSITSLF